MCISVSTESQKILQVEKPKDLPLHFSKCGVVTTDFCVVFEDPALVFNDFATKHVVGTSGTRFLGCNVKVVYEVASMALIQLGPMIDALLRQYFGDQYFAT